MVNAHGLAASIRAAQESETFDLGGQNVSTISKTIETAFQEPFLLDIMIRLTFVTGAGKQSRQKYDAGASKAVTAALTKCGYKEDRGASCVLECGGFYKTQHDTGKNLFTVVVFPKVRSETHEKDASEEVEPLIPEDSPGYKIAVSSIPVFRNMATAKCPSWAQKRACLECIQALKELLQELDDKLINGVPLDASEQAYYDAIGSLDEKEALIKEQAQQLVEQGNITAFEKEILLQQNADRIVSLEKQQKPTAKALQRKELLESIEPMEPRQLKYYKEIGKLHKELVPLLKVEAETKGRLLNIKETQLLARKEEIEDVIQYLEEASRGWFEDDDVFASRVKACRKELARQHGSTRRSKGATMTVDSSTKVRVSANKWVTPGGQGYGGKAGSKKSKLKQGGNLFGAMMMDSSSDEEESDEQEEEQTSANVTRETVDNEPSGAPSKKKSSSKKKSKKKKKKGASASQSTEEETTATAQEGGETQVSVASQFGVFLQTYLLPLIIAFLSWLVSLFFGKKKKKKQ